VSAAGTYNQNHHPQIGISGVVLKTITTLEMVPCGHHSARSHASWADRFLLASWSKMFLEAAVPSLYDAKKPIRSPSMLVARQVAEKTTHTFRRPSLNARN
jgi:hypothetical protein